MYEKNKIMKYIKRFNEELRPETYLNAASKLDRDHPSRAKILRDYGLSKNPTIYDKEWDFIITGTLYGTISGAKLSENGRYFEFENTIQNLKGDSSTKNWPESELSIDYISITENGLKYGDPYANYEGHCYVKTRQKAFELKKDLEKIGVNVDVNKLYKEIEDPYKTCGGYIFTPLKKKPWYKGGGYYNENIKYNEAEEEYDADIIFDDVDLNRFITEIMNKCDMDGDSVFSPYFKQYYSFKNFLRHLGVFCVKNGWKITKMNK